MYLSPLGKKNYFYKLTGFGETPEIEVPQSFSNVNAFNQFLAKIGMDHYTVPYLDN